MLLMMEISMRMFVNLLFGDEVDALVDLAEATSTDLSRHFPSLLDITMKMTVLMTLTTTTMTVMTTMIITMTGMIKTLTMCPGCRRSSLDWWLVIFKQRLGKVFFVEIFDGCYFALGHYWSFKYELAVPLFVFVSISAKCSCSRSSSERVWKEAH